MSIASLASGASPWPACAFAPDAPVRVALVANPNAGQLRGRADERVRELSALAGGAPLVASNDPAESAERTKALLRDGVNVLAVAGGDGTLHHTVQGLAKWPGALLPVPDGTLNIVARAAAADPLEALLRIGGRRFGEVPRRELATLRVGSPSQGTRTGFVFGSEMVKNALELYDRFGGGYAGLSRFLVEVGRGYLFKTRLWREESWRLTPPVRGCSVDGREVPTYAAVVAATCELAVARGTVRALSPRDPEGFSARIVTETRLGPLLGLIPTLMREGAAEGVVEEHGVRELRLDGAYTLDGEVYGASSPGGASGEPLTVRAGPPVRLVI